MISTMPQVTVRTLAEMKRNGEKIAALTCYDASFARVLESAGVDVLLVGDSLGMVVQGHDTTLPVTTEDVIYHTGAVARARSRALLIADMPFMSDASMETALGAAGRLVKEGEPRWLSWREAHTSWNWCVSLPRGRWLSVRTWACCPRTSIAWGDTSCRVAMNTRPST